MEKYLNIVLLLVIRNSLCGFQTFYSAIDIYPPVLNACKPFEGFQLTFNDRWLGENGFNYASVSSNLYNISPILFFLNSYSQDNGNYNKVCVNDNCITTISDFIPWNPTRNTNTTFRVYYDSTNYNPFKLLSVTGNLKLLESYKKNYYFFTYTLSTRTSFTPGKLNLEFPVAGGLGYYSFSFYHPCIFIPENTVVEFRRPINLKSSIDIFQNFTCQASITGSPQNSLTCNFINNSLFIYNLFNTTSKEVTYANKNIEIKLFGLRTPFQNNGTYQLLFYNESPVDYNNFLYANFFLPPINVPPLVLKNFLAVSMLSNNVTLKFNLETSTPLSIIVGQYFYISFPKELTSLKTLKITISQKDNSQITQTSSLVYNNSAIMLINNNFQLDKGITVVVSDFGKENYSGVGNVKIGFIDAYQALITQEYSLVVNFVS